MFFVMFVDSPLFGKLDKLAGSVPAAVHGRAGVLRLQPVSPWSCRKYMPLSAWKIAELVFTRRGAWT